MSVCLPSEDVFCTIMSTLMLASASGPKMLRGHARLVLDPEEGHLRLVLGVGDAADDVLLHDLILAANDGADLVPGFRPRGLQAPRGATKLDSTRTRILCTMASSTERVCSTLEPSEAISSISS